MAQGGWLDITGYQNTRHGFRLANGDLSEYSKVEYQNSQFVIMKVKNLETILWLSLLTQASFRLYFLYDSYLSTGSPAICQARVDNGSPRVAASEKLSDTGTFFSRHKLHHSLIHSWKDHPVVLISAIQINGWIHLNTLCHESAYFKTQYWASQQVQSQRFTVQKHSVWPIHPTNVVELYS